MGYRLNGENIRDMLVRVGTSHMGLVSVYKKTPGEFASPFCYVPTQTLGSQVPGSWGEGHSSSRMVSSVFMLFLCYLV